MQLAFEAYRDSLGILYEIKARQFPPSRVSSRRRSAPRDVCIPLHTVYRYRSPHFIREDSRRNRDGEASRPLRCFPFESTHRLVYGRVRILTCVPSSKPYQFDDPCDILEILESSIFHPPLLEGREKFPSWKFFRNIGVMGKENFYEIIFQARINKRYEELMKIKRIMMRRM